MGSEPLSHCSFHMNPTEGEVNKVIRENWSHRTVLITVIKKAGQARKRRN